jgi:putative peptide zinc metalloprotease protein
MAKIALAGTAAPDKQASFSFRPENGVPALRRDLNITQVSYRRRRNWVVKDPASLRYFRWGEWDYRVARLLDGKRQLEEITAELSRSLGTEVDPDQIMQTVNHMLGAGLLRSNGTVARRLHESQRDTERKKKKKTRWISLASKLISFKITLFDPDLLLLRMSKKLRFLWTPGALFVLLLMLASSVWLMLANLASLAERMPDILGWENLLILWLVMIGVKVVHEFGHGLACKHFGGEVHEMGAMFILFSPFLFCNASDSWTFRDKRRRLVVNFAGIYLELFLAAVAAALWVLTQPGLFNQICFNVMLVCSVMTVFFNANPLMKFDGYYALSDWMEVPNLKERGDRALISNIAGLLTGGQGVGKDPLVAQMRGRMMFYAVASYVWTFLIAYNILIIMGQMLEPYGLDRLVQAAASLALLTGVVAPPIMIGLHLRKVFASDADPDVRRKALRRVAAAALLLVLVLAIPWPVNVRSACVIDAVDSVRITSETAGFAREVACSDGQRVAPGDILAVLENPEVERQVKNYEIRLAELQAAVAAAEADPDYRKSVSGLRMQAEQVGTALKQAELDRERLTLRSPIAGVVSGRGLREKSGTLLRRGDLLCEVLPEGSAGAVVALGENEAGKIAPGQTVAFRLSSFAGQTFSGRVLAVTEQPVARLPHQSLGQQAGGTVPGVMSAAPSPGEPQKTEVVPTGQIFSVKVAIDDNKGLLRPGMSGRIKIHCGRRPLGLTLWDNFTSMLRTDFRL